MLTEQGPEYGKGYTPFKRLRLASGFAIGLALASCAPEQEVSPTPTEPKLTPTPIAIEVPSPTPEPTLTPTPEATPTPEPTPTPEFQFEPYGVYAGDVEGGGKVVFATLADGRVLFASIKPEPKCSNPDYYIYMFATVGSYEAGEFNLVDWDPRFVNRVTATLIDDTTISGVLSSEGGEFGSPSGLVTCKPGSFDFEASLTGNGKERFLEAFKEAVDQEEPAFGLRSLEDAQALFEGFCGSRDPERCKLP